MALLDGRGEAPPPHTWRGLVAVYGISRLYAAASREGAGSGNLAACTGVRTPQARSAPAAREDGPVDQPVETAVDSHLSRGITRAFLWTSRIARKILKLLAGNPCASSPAKSTNSVTAKAEVLPGGNSRNAGETRAAGKPGNRDFSCCFHTGRMVADRQEAGQPAAPVRRGQMGPLRLILGGAPFAYPGPARGPGAHSRTSRATAPSRCAHLSPAAEPPQVPRSRWPLPPTFPAGRAPNRAKHPGRAHRPREKSAEP